MWSVTLFCNKVTIVSYAGKYFYADDDMLSIIANLHRILITIRK